MSTNRPEPPRSPRLREQALAETFVMLADTLVDDHDVVELMDRLVAACLDLLDVSAAGLLLEDQVDGLVVVATSADETRLLEMFQVQRNEGPCLECLRTGVPVASGNLSEQCDRWPLFAPAAIELGYQSVAAVPMRLRSQSIGALNLFNVTPEPISNGAQRLAQALADVATIGILQQRIIAHGSLVAEQLQHALQSRIAVEQAKGVIAERNALSMQDAFAVLRGYARSHNLKLTDVAVSVVRGDLHPERIEQTVPRRSH